MNPFEVLVKLEFLEMGTNGYYYCKSYGSGVVFSYEPSGDLLTVSVVNMEKGFPFPYNMMYVEGLSCKTIRIENDTAYLELGGSELVFNRY